MKTLVTGATGFVGRWLVRELEAAGHDAVGTPASAELDITDLESVRAFVTRIRPQAVVHLAGVSYGPDARRDPGRAMTVNEGGTEVVMQAIGNLDGAVPILVVSSAEVYGNPDPSDLPLRESAPLLTDQPYGLSKLAQERIAFDSAALLGIPVVVARAFNHTGPGQRSEFVVPAYAARIIAARESGDRSIRAGNIEVRRDIGDVRDVVRAYRLLIEAMAESRLPGEHVVFNVASGRTVAIREVIDHLASLAGIDVTVEVDPSLVRANDPAEISADTSLLAAEVGWHPIIPLEATLADVLREASAIGR